MHTILVIGPTPPPVHGVSSAMHLLLQSALQQKFRVLHLELADRRGIEHVDKPDLHDVWLFIRQWLSLFRLLRHRPRLTYLAISQSTIGFLRDSLFIWPAYLAGSRIVLHLHGGNFQTWHRSRGPLMRRYVGWTLSVVAQAVVLGGSLRNSFEGLVASERIAVVPNGVRRPSPSSRPVTTWPKGRSHRVLSLGTLNRLKGTLVLLKAVPLVVRHRPDVEFVLAGAWSHEEDRRTADAMIRDHGMEDHVVFSGQVLGADKEALLESADLFVFPGVQQEGQPLVVLEAMAAGLPILCTDRGCLRDTIVDRESGLLLRLNDPEQVAEQLLWLLDRPGEMKRMGAQARARFERYYTSDRFQADMTSIFERVAGGPV
jgi:glycosyltransferase involved in cell wall biosynthesis